MSVREVAFAVFALLAAALITYGVALLAAAAGFIVAGVLLVGWAWLVLGEVGK